MIAFVDWQWGTFDGKMVTAHGALIGFSAGTIDVPGAGKQPQTMAIVVNFDDHHIYEVPLHLLTWDRWDS